MQFSECLSSLMKAANEKNAQLAEAIGVSEAIIGKWLKGSIPSSDKLALIADHYGVSMDYLYRGTTANETWDEETLDLANRFSKLPRDYRYKVFVSLIDAEREAAGIASSPYYNQKAPAELADAGVLGVQTATNRPLTPEEIAAIRRLLDQSKD
jgi:transcriptional regulator with XRE-family HTH domain